MKYYSFYLVGICTAVFIFQSIFPIITDNFALIQNRALSEPWMFLTSIFLHGDILHLMYNMLALGLFGFILEKIIGSKLFLITFFATGIIASVGSFLFYHASLGASGAVFGILGALAAIRPKMMVWVYVPMPMILAIFIWIAMDLFGFFYPSGTANAAHLAGLGAGIVFGLFLRKQFGEREIRKCEVNDSKFRNWENEWM